MLRTYTQAKRTIRTHAKQFKLAGIFTGFMLTSYLVPMLFQFAALSATSIAVRSAYQTLRTGTKEQKLQTLAIIAGIVVLNGALGVSLSTIFIIGATVVAANPELRAKIKQMIQATPKTTLLKIMASAITVSAIISPLTMFLVVNPAFISYTVITQSLLSWKIAAINTYTSYIAALNAYLSALNASGSYAASYIANAQGLVFFCVSAATASLIAIKRAFTMTAAERKAFLRKPETLSSLATLVGFTTCAFFFPMVFSVITFTTVGIGAQVALKNLTTGSATKKLNTMISLLTISFLNIAVGIPMPTILMSAAIFVATRPALFTQIKQIKIEPTALMKIVSAASTFTVLATLPFQSLFLPLATFVSFGAALIASKKNKFKTEEVLTLTTLCALCSSLALGSFSYLFMSVLGANSALKPQHQPIQAADENTAVHRFLVKSADVVTFGFKHVCTRVQSAVHRGHQAVVAAAPAVLRHN